MKRLITLLLLSALTIFCYSKDPIKVACVGNSITYGASLEDRKNECYPSVLQQRLGADYIVGNFGRNGATLLNKGHRPYVKTEEFQSALEMKADVVVIHLGINDTDPRNYPNYQEEFMGDYLSLIDSFRVANPKARIILCRLTPITSSHVRFKAGTREWHKGIQVEIERVARVSKCELVDLHEVLYPHPNLLPDAVHPNAKGAKMLAERIYSAISGDFGGLKMNVLFGDNMVLQRGEKTKIYGKANVGEEIKISLNGTNVNKSAKANADFNGNWVVELPLDCYATDCELKISAKSCQLSYKNVAIGEVWMASGQSNMSWPVGASFRSENALESDNIRLFKCNPPSPKQDSLFADELERLNNLDYIGNDGWKSGERENLNSFSGIGYFFAQELRKSLGDIPIGIIQTSLGGGTAESFVSRDLIESDNQLVDMLPNWRNSHMINQWCRDVGYRSLKGTSDKVHRHYFEPCFLYESRILPIKGYSLRGTLWYQGESNADNIEIHESIFPKVVASFRGAFGEQMPFYFVQLSSLNRPSWARFRDSQRRLAENIDNCEMVVSSDHGNPTDVHPQEKEIIAQRLANVALACQYSKKIQYRSPKAVKVEKNVITFSETGGNLTTGSSEEVVGFEVADDNMVFRPVKAKIKANSIILDVDYANHVRYAWKCISDGNLYGSSGLPVSTFIISQ